MIENPTTIEERFANIQELVHQYVPGLPVEWDKATVRFGCCHCKVNEYGKPVPVRITISKPLSMTNTWATIREIVLHEIAHALTPGHGHDVVWKAKCRELGCSDERCYTPVGSRKQTDGPKVYPAKNTASVKPYTPPPRPDVYRYLTICDKCGKIVGGFMRRPTNTYTHSLCGGTTSLVPNPLFAGKQYVDLGALADDLEKNLVFLFSRCSAVLGVAREGSREGHADRKKAEAGAKDGSVSGADKKGSQGNPASQKAADKAARAVSAVMGESKPGPSVVVMGGSKPGPSVVVMGGSKPGSPVGRSLRKLFILCDHVPTAETRRSLYQKLAAKYEHLQTDGKSDFSFAAMDIFTLSHNKHVYIMPVYFTPEDLGKYIGSVLSGEQLAPRDGFYPIRFLAEMEWPEVLFERNGAWTEISLRIQARPQALFAKWYEKELADMKNMDLDLREALAEAKRVGGLRLKDIVRFQETGFTSMIDQLSRVGVAEKFLARYIRALFALNECYGTQASPNLESVEAELEGFKKKPLACVKRLKSLEKKAESAATFGEAAGEMRALISELEALAK